MKAKNEGTCQICGARQKLPGGLLAAHGYRVDYNQFIGVCPGSGHLPYEQSRDQLNEYRWQLIAEQRNLTQQLEVGAYDSEVEKYNLERGIRYIGRDIEIQNKRFAQWQTRPLLPLTGSAEDKAQRPAKPKSPSKKELAAAKYRADFIAKYGFEPQFETRQTTANNRMLHAIEWMLYTLSYCENWTEADGLSNERRVAALKKTASELMNTKGYEATLAWFNELLGVTLSWNERKEELELNGQRAMTLRDAGISLEKAKALVG